MPLSHIATNENIETSWVYFIGQQVQEEINKIKGKTEKSVWISFPDLSKENIQTPIVIAKFMSETESPVGLGKLGHGGRRQTIYNITLAVGVVARTSAEVNRLMQKVKDKLSDRHFLDIYEFTLEGLKGRAVAKGRIKMAAIDYSPPELEGMTHKTAMATYNFVLYKNISEEG